MKILVTVKRVPDPETTIRVNADNSGIVTDNVKYVINPFDEIAIEEGLRIKEKVSGSEVILASIGHKGQHRAVADRAGHGRRPGLCWCWPIRNLDSARRGPGAGHAGRKREPRPGPDGQAGD